MLSSYLSICSFLFEAFILYGFAPPISAGFIHAAMLTMEAIVMEELPRCHAILLSSELHLYKQLSLPFTWKEEKKTPLSFDNNSHYKTA